MVRASHLRRLGAQLDSWGAVDTFACYVAGPAWRAEQISDAEVARWARSPNRWWRRAALVSTVPLNVKAQGGTGDARRTRTICRILVDDRDEMVVKAMSWALRSLAAPDPAAVAAFVDDYRGRLAPRVLREVRNKLTTGRKTKRKVGTVKGQST
jgi:3-methyladenine DNA glycosylase AlkD